MIVVAGEALIDQLVLPDGSVHAVPGGGPFNVARTIARLDQRVAFLGRLSGDDFGRTLYASLEEDGVDLSLSEWTEAPTTSAIAEVDASGAATYRFRTTATSAPGLSAAAVGAALATRPLALHVGSLGLVLEPMAAAIAEGVARSDPTTLVMLDPNCRPAAIADRAAYLGRLDTVLRRADIVKVSRDDIAYLTPGTASIRAVRELLGRGPAVILLTDGPNPVVAITPSFEFERAAPEVDVVDTVGAGDAFGGAFLARWIEHGFGRAELADEVALREAVAFAIEVAAFTCGRAGADPPHRAELPRSTELP